jgi:hypothetical protein
MARITGKDGVIKIDATTLKVASWSGDFSADTHDVSEAGNGGYMSRIFGLKKADGSFTVHYDPTAEPTLAEGDTVDATFTTNGTLGKHVPSCLITKVSYKVEPNSPITLDCSWESDGTYNTVVPGP